jgi:acyl-CoA synthetase (AMP-forming)/AMP-acid ligase II
MTLIQVDLLARLAEAFPDGVAWKHLGDGDELRLVDWHARSNQLARGMRAQGVKPGDRVALSITPNEPLEWLTSYMAIHKLGAIAVPLNTRLSPVEHLRILRLAEPKIILTSSGILDDGVATAELPALVATTGTPRGSAMAWSDLFDPDPSDLGHQLREDDVADIMYTSGTTGAPKGVVVRHGGLSTNDRVPEEWTGAGFMMGSPFSTTTGSLLVCGPIRGGMTGWFLPKFDAETWLRIAETDRPSVIMLVPAMMQLVVAHPYFERADLSSISVISIGSAPVASATLRRFGARIPGAEIVVGYGMTEFGAATSMPLGDLGKHLGSVGQALPGVQLRIGDEEGNDLPTGEVGEVLIKGERPQREYFNDPEGSERTWTGGWLKSGDLGYLDADGFLWIVGRSKETIIRGGNNIMPGEIESALFTHPAVADAAVTGIPHPVLGEDVAAWVVLRPDHTASVESIREFLLERLADYKVPRRITFVDALPRNDGGKVVKAQLVLDDQPTDAST